MPTAMGQPPPQPPSSSALDILAPILLQQEPRANLSPARSAAAPAPAWAPQVTGDGWQGGRGRSPAWPVSRRALGLAPSSARCKRRDIRHLADTKPGHLWHMPGTYQTLQKPHCYCVVITLVQPKTHHRCARRISGDVATPRERPKKHGRARPLHPILCATQLLNLDSGLPSLLQAWSRGHAELFPKVPETFFP